MITVKTDSKKFFRDMEQLTDYALGFLDGAKSGVSKLERNIGGDVVEALRQFIDSNARVNPETLHHVYEWHKTGSPESRLFEISYDSGSSGLTINATLSQSKSVRIGSRTPFYDKAMIMESGVPVTIAPKRTEAIAFEANGETVFTKKPFTVESPGGPLVSGSFEKIFNSFFENYFRQSYLRSSGILDHIKNPSSFGKNLRQAKAGGRAAGSRVGYNWITQTGLG
jgi:hypothetical protein